MRGAEGSAAKLSARLEKEDDLFVARWRVVLLTFRPGRMRLAWHMLLFGQHPADEGSP